MKNFTIFLVLFHIFAILWNYFVSIMPIQTKSFNSFKETFTMSLYFYIGIIIIFLILLWFFYFQENHLSNWRKNLSKFLRNIVFLMLYTVCGFFVLSFVWTIIFPVFLALYCGFFVCVWFLFFKK